MMNSVPEWWQSYQSNFTEIEATDFEFGRWLFAQNSQFTAAAQTLDRLPMGTLPEVAFVGRSNVGKSSLLNKLVNRKSLARTSNTPGRTQQINFFDLGGRLCLVDLPGYGYAKVSRTMSNSWNKVMLTYLKNRPHLERVCLLIDGRHGVKDNDREMMALLDKSAVAYCLILTKCDKVKKDDLQKLLQDLHQEMQQHPACFPFAIPTSTADKDATNGGGIELLRALLGRFAVAP